MKTLFKILTPTISTIGIATISLASCGNSWKQITQDEFLAKFKDIDAKTTKYTQSQWESAKYSISSSSCWYLNSKPLEKHQFKNTSIKCMNDSEGNIVPYLYFDDPDFPVPSFHMACGLYNTYTLWKQGFESWKELGFKMVIEESSAQFLLKLHYNDKLYSKVFIRKSDGIVISGIGQLGDIGVTSEVTFTSFEIGK